MHPSPRSRARNLGGVLLLSAAFLVAGCHRAGNVSFYGVAWVTVTSDGGAVSAVSGVPVEFASYIVTIDSITLTRSDGILVTALATPEIIDLAQIKNTAEFYGTATVPDGTYVSATITLDYTDAAISVIVNGVPTAATVIGPSGSSLTTLSETVNFPATGQLVVSPTYASTSAQRMALKIDLAASGYVDTSAATPVVVANPSMTVSVQPSDTKLIRIRGPLINTNVDVGTYTVYVRPFYDDVSNLGQLSLFNTPTTVYTVNGQAYTGIAGIDAFAQLSAGSTITAAYATFVPSVNPLNNAPAGTFYPVYVVGGSTLEDNYTEGLIGEVIARTGDTLTLRGSTLNLNTADTFAFETADTQVLLGAGTLVTADGVPSVAGLNSNSIAVGQHVAVRGIYSILASGQIQIDATGTSSTNTGSVRLLQTELWGSLTALGAGSLTMNLATIDDYPASVFNFTGNGAAAPTPAAFQVATGSLAVPAGTVAGDPVWIGGLAAPFGSSPPSFTAYAVNDELSVQNIGNTNPAAGAAQSCGAVNMPCSPASLRVLFSYYLGGTASPFLTLSNAGFTVDLANPALVTATIRIGPESIDLRSAPANPTIVPTTLGVTTTFSPQFTIGNPATATVTPTVTAATSSIVTYSSFPDFVSEYYSVVSATDAVLQVDAEGVFDRATNTFTATSVNVVL